MALEYAGGIRYQLRHIPRFLRLVGGHVRGGFGRPEFRAVADRVAELAVGESAELTFPVTVDAAPTELVVRLYRDHPRSVVMGFRSGCQTLLRRIDDELPGWCEGTEPTWPAGV